MAKRKCLVSTLTGNTLPPAPVWFTVRRWGGDIRAVLLAGLLESWAALTSGAAMFRHTSPLHPPPTQRRTRPDPGRDPAGEKAATRSLNKWKWIHCRVHHTLLNLNLQWYLPYLLSELCILHCIVSRSHSHYTQPFNLACSSISQQRDYLFNFFLLIIVKIFGG